MRSIWFWSALGGSIDQTGQGSTGDGITITDVGKGVGVTEGCMVTAGDGISEGVGVRVKTGLGEGGQS